MDSVSPGDIAVTTFTISSDRGSLDLTSSFSSASIYESIFTPGIVADITVLDTDDLLGKMKLFGDESVTINFTTPGGTTANYKLAVHKLEEVKTVTSSLKSKSYVIKLVSEESHYAKNNYVQKNFNTQISSMVKTIVKDYLHSSKKVDAEDTKGTQKILISHQNPYKAIDMVRRRAISSENKSSLFVFFETRSGSDQIFKFSTIEKLFKGSAVKSFKQSDAVSTDISNKFDNQIIALEVPTQFNASDRIATGGEVKVSRFNFQTHQYISEKKTPKLTDYTSGGSGDPNSSTFTSKYRQAGAGANPNLLLIGEDTSKRANTHIPTNTADQQAYIASLMQNSVKMRVPGDLNIKAGDVINADIPNKKSTTDNSANDPILSGKFLVSRIHHEIGPKGETPRYTCVIECLKGNTEQGV